MATGLSLSTSGSLQSMSKTIIAEAIDQIEPAAPLKGLVSDYPIPSGSYQVNVPIWGRLTAAALTEGVDLAVPQQLTTTVVQLTASEHGILSFISDKLAHENNESVLSAIGSMQGRAMGRLLDGDLITLIQNFDGTSGGGAGAATSMFHIAGAVSYLRTDNNAAYGPAPSRPNAVLHPEQIRRLTTEMAGLTSTSAAATAATGFVPEGPSADVLKQYWRGNDPIFGVPIFEDGNISLDGSNDVKGAVFVKEALALAMESEINAEEERDASLRGTELVTSAIWGESEVVGVWGVVIYSMADALPS